LQEREGRPTPNATEAARKIDEAQTRYRKSPKGKKATRKYLDSEKGKEAVKRYNDTDKAKLNRLNYQSTDKGKESLAQTERNKRIMRKARRLFLKEGLSIEEAIDQATKEEECTTSQKEEN